MSSSPITNIAMVTVGTNLLFLPDTIFENHCSSMKNYPVSRSNKKRGLKI